MIQNVIVIQCTQLQYRYYQWILVANTHMWMVVKVIIACNDLHMLVSYAVWVIFHSETSCLSQLVPHSGTQWLVCKLCNWGRVCVGLWHVLPVNADHPLCLQDRLSDAVLDGQANVNLTYGSSTVSVPTLLFPLQFIYFMTFTYFPSQLGELAVSCSSQFFVTNLCDADQFSSPVNGNLVWLWCWQSSLALTEQTAPIEVMLQRP